MLPILYSFRRCPYAIRARMALNYAKVKYEHREVILKDKPQAMLQASPKGTVPVLVTPQQVIDESIDIMLWALAQHDPQQWLPQTTAQHTHTQQLIHANDHDFKRNLDRYKYPERYPEEQQSSLYFRKLCTNTLATLEKILTNSKFLLGENISLVDIAIFPFIRQFARVDLTWFTASQYHHLKSWLTYHENSKLFTYIMQKHAPWQE